MDEQSKKPDYSQAFAETVAAVPKVRGWKEETAARLQAGEPEESVVSWLSRATRSHMSRAERLLGFHRWFVLWVLEWAKTGSPGPFYVGVRGTVGSGHWRLGRRDSIPLVYVVAGPTSDPEALARDFLAKCKEVFPPETWTKKADPQRDARWFRLFEEGMEDWDIHAASPKKDQWSGGAATVRQGRSRWAAYIKGVTLRVTSKGRPR